MIRQEHKTEILDVVFGAVADATRRSILDRLRDGALTVTELANPYAMSLNAVSKHIKTLERAGLIRLTGSGVCNCFAGYSGDACDGCSDGFVMVGAVCTFLPGSIACSGNRTAPVCTGESSTSRMSMLLARAQSIPLAVLAPTVVVAVLVIGVALVLTLRRYKLRRGSAGASGGRVLVKAKSGVCPSSSSNSSCAAPESTATNTDTTPAIAANAPSLSVPSSPMPSESCQWLPVPSKDSCDTGGGGVRGSAVCW